MMEFETFIRHLEKQVQVLIKQKVDSLEALQHIHTLFQNDYDISFTRPLLTHHHETMNNLQHCLVALFFQWGNYEQCQLAYRVFLLLGFVMGSHQLIYPKNYFSLLDYDSPIHSLALEGWGLLNFVHAFTPEPELILESYMHHLNSLSTTSVTFKASIDAFPLFVHYFQDRNQLIQCQSWFLKKLLMVKGPFAQRIIENIVIIQQETPFDITVIKRHYFKLFEHEEDWRAEIVKQLNDLPKFHHKNYLLDYFSSQPETPIVFPKYEKKTILFPIVIESVYQHRLFEILISVFGENWQQQIEKAVPGFLLYFEQMQPIETQRDIKMLKKGKLFDWILKEEKVYSQKEDRQIKNLKRASLWHKRKGTNMNKKKQWSLFDIE